MSFWEQLKAIRNNYSLQSQQNDVAENLGEIVNIANTPKDKYVAKQIENGAWDGMPLQAYKDQLIEQYDETKNKADKLMSLYYGLDSQINDNQKAINNSNSFVKGAFGLAGALPHTIDRGVREFAPLAVGYAAAPFTMGASVPVSKFVGAAWGANKSFDTEYGHAYMRALQQGASPEVADLYAKRAGGIKAVLGGGKPIGGLKTVFGELGKEGVENFAQAINDNYKTNEMFLPMAPSNLEQLYAYKRG